MAVSRARRKALLRARIYAAIAAHIEACGYPPTHRELSREAKLCRSALCRHLEVMEALGYIERDSWHGRTSARGIRLIRAPEP